MHRHGMTFFIILAIGFATLPLPAQADLYTFVYDAKAPYGDADFVTLEVGQQYTFTIDTSEILVPRSISYARLYWYTFNDSHGTVSISADGNAVYSGELNAINQWNPESSPFNSDYMKHALLPGLVNDDGAISFTLANTGTTMWQFDRLTMLMDGTEASPVPVPGAVWLLGSGLVGLVALRRRFKK